MIKANKVGLRAVEKKDLLVLQHWRNIPELRKNFREFRELNMLMQEQWLQRITESPNDFMFTIVRLYNNKPIGVCGLTYINWIIRSADVSFYIGENGRYIDSRGYSDEAIKLLMQYGFQDLNLNKLWIELYEFDHKKINFFKKYNFKKDGVLRDNCFKDGKYWNSLVYSLLKKEYHNK